MQEGSVFVGEVVLLKEVLVKDLHLVLVELLESADVCLTQLGILHLEVLLFLEVTHLDVSQFFFELVYHSLVFLGVLAVLASEAVDLAEQPVDFQGFGVDDVDEFRIFCFQVYDDGVGAGLQGLNLIFVELLEFLSFLKVGPPVELFNRADFLLQLALILNQIQLPIVLLYFLDLLGLSQLIDLILHTINQISQLLNLHIMPQNQQFLLLIMILLEMINSIFKHNLLLRQFHLLHMMYVDDLIVQINHFIFQLVGGGLELESHQCDFVVFGLEEASHLHFLELGLLTSAHLVLGHRLEVLDLLVVQRVFQEGHLLGIHKVSMLFLLIQPIYLVDQLFDLPLIIFELLMRLPYKLCLLELYSLKSHDLCPDLVLQLLLKSNDDLASLLKHHVQFCIFASKSFVLLQQALDINIVDLLVSLFFCQLGRLVVRVVVSLIGLLDGVGPSWLLLVVFILVVGRGILVEVGVGRSSKG